MEKDSYFTLKSATEEYLLKEKNSKFYGYAFHVKSEEEVRNCLEMIKSQHKTARHFCYAYQIGTIQKQWRANDDGEPNNSAGLPIYGQIQSFELTNVMVIVVRYFGGVKLGVGGLISAYKSTANEVLRNAEIIEKTINEKYILQFEYKNLNKVMRILKEKNLQITSQKMELSCEIEFETRKNNSEQIEEIFNEMFGITLKNLE
jgi:uncharacterized YigZ family protein